MKKKNVQAETVKNSNGKAYSPHETGISLQIFKHPFSDQKIDVQVNELVCVKKEAQINRQIVYSIEIPIYGQAVHLKPETAVKVVEALTLLLNDKTVENSIPECIVINLMEYVSKKQQIKTGK